MRFSLPFLWLSPGEKAQPVGTKESGPFGIQTMDLWRIGGRHARVKRRAGFARPDRVAKMIKLLVNNLIKL